MNRRRDLSPGLGEDSNVSLDDVLQHLQLWKTETLATIEALRSYREEVEQNASRLEHPRAAIEYIDFFADLFGRWAADFDGILADPPDAIRGNHIDTLRQIASNSAAERRRCVSFRDKWINKILSDERMRPLLDGISVITRDQLTDYRDLTVAAARLAALAGPAEGQTEQGARESAIGRRELFNKLFKP